MKNALVSTFLSLPGSLRRSLTWDRGKELSAHELLTKRDRSARFYFADAKSPWQRGSNEHLNGLIRPYLPKGTDLSRWSEREIVAVAHAIDNGPREILGSRTPAEAFSRSYSQSKEQLLRRPVEYGQFRAEPWPVSCAVHDMVGSMGRVGAAGTMPRWRAFWSASSNERPQPAAVGDPAGAAHSPWSFLDRAEVSPPTRPGLPSAA